MVSALLGAGLLSYLSRSPTKDPASKTLKTEGTSLRNSESKYSEKGPPLLRHARVQRYEARGEDVSNWELPHMDSVRQSRQEPAPEPRADIKERGILALTADIHCQAPYEFVQTGLSGPGDVGCGILGDAGQVIALGKWVKRTMGGDYEVSLFERGERNGEFQLYSADGYLLRKGNYEYGSEQGTWDEYSKTRAHLRRITYDAGQYHGLCTFYTQNEPVVELWNHGDLIKQKSGVDDLRRAPEGKDG